MSGFDPSRFVAGGYRDRSGTYWHVVFAESGDARCWSEEGSSTSFFADTFAKLRSQTWEPEWELPRDNRNPEGEASPPDHPHERTV